MLTHIGRAEYSRRRSQGWQAHMAFHAAVVQERWRFHEIRGDVRLRWETDSDSYPEDVMGERDPSMSDKAWKAYVAEVTAMVERDGINGCIAEYRDPISGEWLYADSVWGFIGTDADMYEPDLKRSALDAWDKANGEEAAELGKRATYAGPV